MRLAALVVACGLGATALTGCSFGDDDDKKDVPGSPAKVSAQVSSDPVPNIAALGDGWVETTGQTPKLALCGKPVIATGDATTKVASDPEERTVSVSFIKVDDSAEATRHTTDTINACVSTVKGDTMTLAWSTPSHEFSSGTTGYVLPLNSATSVEKAGGGAVAVASATGGVIVAVVVSPGANNTVANETLQAYADLIAANQVAANTSVTPDPVPAIADVKPLLPEPTGLGEDEIPTGPTTPEETGWTPTEDATSETP